MTGSKCSSSCKAICACVCTHHLNEHRGGTGQCFECPCKAFAEAPHEHGLRVLGDTGAVLFTRWFPTRTRRALFADGFRLGVLQLQPFLPEPMPFSYRRLWRKKRPKT